MPALRRALVPLLILALFHMGVLPVRAEIQTARQAGWDATSTRGLTLLETRPEQRHRLQVVTRCGEHLECVGAHLLLLDEGAYRDSYSAWRALASSRRSLPELGEALVIESRFQRGRPLEGRFAGFDGPLLLLETPTGSQTILPIPMDGLALSSPSGRLTLSAPAVDRGEDWPPPRSVLEFVVKGDPLARVRTLPLDSLRSLNVRGGASSMLFFLLPALLIALLIWGHSDEEWNLFGSDVM